MFTVLVLVLLRFSGSLVTCMTRPMLSDLNTDDVHNYTFGGSCNTVEDPLEYVSKNIKDVKLK